MKIAIVVQGRFHAFDLVRALLERGHEVNLFTNYPKWAVKRFGIPGANVRSFRLHGVLFRLALFLHERIRFFYPEAWLHMLFGRWAARELGKGDWDVIHCWSGISEEILQVGNSNGTLKLLMRGSAHIQSQARILEEEEKRTGVLIDRPSSWMLAREQREYKLAGDIRVLSRFAYKTFLDEGVPSDKLHLIPSGVSVKTFRPAPEIMEARCQRILSGDPLRVLFVGTVSFRKGAYDMVTIIRCLGGHGFHFSLVGPVASEAKKLLRELRQQAEFIRKQPQGKLPDYYNWTDLFLFPSLEEGYAQVLGQASATGVPILTTTNGPGPDIVIQDETGWILPIRQPEMFIEKLKWCATHRKELAEMVWRIYNEFRPRDWSEVARDFEELCVKSLKEGKRLRLLHGHP